LYLTSRNANIVKKDCWLKVLFGYCQNINALNKVAETKKEYSVKCPRCYSLIKFKRSRVTHGKKFLVVCGKCGITRFVAVFEKVEVYDLKPITELEGEKT